MDQITDFINDYRRPFPEPLTLSGSLGAVTAATTALLLSLALKAYRAGMPPGWYEGLEVAGAAATLGLLVFALALCRMEAVNSRDHNAFVLRMEEIKHDATLPPEARIRLEMIRNHQPGEYLCFTDHLPTTTDCQNHENQSQPRPGPHRSGA